MCLFKTSRQFFRNLVSPTRGPRQSSDVMFVRSLLFEAREPDKNIFTFAHRQRRKSVFTILGHEISEDRCAGICRGWLERLLEKFNEAGAQRRAKVINRRHDQFLQNFVRSSPSTFLVFEREPGGRRRRAQDEA